MKTSPRICLDARFWRSQTGGLGRYTRELIHHLATIDRQTNYTVLLTPEDEPEWDVKQANFRPLVIPIPHYSLLEQTRLPFILNREQFDLVHFLNFNHPLAYRGKFITTIHDLTLYLFPSDSGKKQQRLKHLAFRAVFRHSITHATKVIAISKYTAADIQKNFGTTANQIKVIYEGRPDRRVLSPHHQTAVQNYLHTDQPYFLFVSQWRPHKGIMPLIKAFDLFKEQTHLPHHLVLIGNQKAASLEIKEALKSAKFKNAIITPGFAPEAILPALYHQALALVVPSEYEGFGLPVLEALTYDTPVIVADNSSLPEVTGKAGLYFPTNHVPTLAKRLNEIATDPALISALRQKGPAQLAQFSWAKTAEETLNLYQEVLPLA